MFYLLWRVFFGYSIALDGYYFIIGYNDLMLSWVKTLTILSILHIAAVLALSLESSADCTSDTYGYPKCGMGQCLNDEHGKVICSPKAGGGCAKNIYGQVECGPGQCVTDIYGKVVCSPRPGGGCGSDPYGKVICN